MNYFFAKEVDYSAAEAVERLTNELKQHGFGILSQIDVQKTLKERIGADIRTYLILGACNPNFSKEAIAQEDRVGVMLPCNVIVRETNEGRIEVAAINPDFTIKSIDNRNLDDIVEKVKDTMQKVISSL
jgi:uncharacterized protein (DUF302 family)